LIIGYIFIIAGASFSVQALRFSWFQKLI
jgi:hypothetical protein